MIPNVIRHLRTAPGLVVLVVVLGGAIVSGQAQRSDLPHRGRVRLSLSDLEPGLYVLRIEARSRLGTDVTASREVQIRITP
jgi:hypothetical protein